jgi:hypothetical protein
MLAHREQKTGVVLVPDSGGLRTNGRDVPPSGLKTRKTRGLSPRFCSMRNGIASSG